MKNLNVLLLTLGILLLAAGSSVDVSIDTQHQSGMENEDPASHHRDLAVVDWTPFRIATDYSSISGVSADLVSYLNTTLVPAALNWVNATFKVQRGRYGLMRFKMDWEPPQCKYPASVSFGRSLQNFDLLVIVRTLNQSSSDSIVEGNVCEQDVDTKRPNIIQLNFNIGKLKTDEASWASNLGKTLQEIIYTLYFREASYEFFYDPTTTNKRVSNLYGTKTFHGISTMGIVHPKVLAEARAYFGCDNLSFIPLENQGDRNEKYSHWERTLFGNELMTYTVDGRAPVSRITLALAEASGWYMPNYNMSESMIWGKGRGCNFTDSPCLDGRETTKGVVLNAIAPEFCTQAASKGCNYEFTAAGKCDMKSPDTVLPLPPAVWNYFKNNTVTSDQYADNCFTIAASADRYCENTDSKAAGDSIEYFGASSACFVSTLVKPAKASIQDGRCFKYTCTLGSDNLYTLTVTVNGKNVTCNSENQSIPSPTKDLQGNLICPDPQNFCQLKVGTCPRACGGAGTCTNGVCTCNAGRKGPDCLRNA